MERTNHVEPELNDPSMSVEVHQPKTKDSREERQARERVIDSYDVMRKSLLLDQKLFKDHAAWRQFVTELRDPNIGWVEIKAKYPFLQTAEQGAEQALLYRQDKVAFDEKFVVKMEQMVATGFVELERLIPPERADLRSRLPQVRAEIAGLMSRFRSFAASGRSLADIVQGMDNKERTAGLALALSSINMDSVSALISVLVFIVGAMAAESLDKDKFKSRLEPAFWEEILYFALSSKATVVIVAVIALGSILFPSMQWPLAIYAGTAIAARGIGAARIKYKEAPDKTKEALRNRRSKAIDKTTRWARRGIKDILTGKRHKGGIPRKEYKALSPAIDKEPAFVPNEAVFFDPLTREILEPDLMGVINVGTGDLIGAYKDMDDRIIPGDKQDDEKEAVIHVLTLWNGNVRPVIGQDIAQDPMNPSQPIPWDNAVPMARIYANTILPLRPIDQATELTDIQKRDIRKLRAGIAAYPILTTTPATILDPRGRIKQEYQELLQRAKGGDYLDVSIEILRTQTGGVPLVPGRNVGTTAWDQAAGTAKYFAMKLIEEATKVKLWP